MGIDDLINAHMQPFEFGIHHLNNKAQSNSEVCFSILINTMHFLTQIMKKLFLALSLTSLSLTQLIAQNEFKKSYDFTNFDAIDVGGTFHVKVKQGDEYQVVFVAQKEKDLQDLDVDVSSGELNIGFENDWSLFGSSKNRGRINVYITMPELESLDISGASKLKVYPFKSIDNLEVDISGAAQANLAIDAKDMEIDASGASKVEITGWVSRLEVDISGASHFSAKEAEVGTADVEASGASHADFGKVEDLDSQTSGASSVSKSKS